MTKTIVKRVGVLKVSLIAGIIMFFVSLVIAVPMAIIMGIVGSTEMSWFALSWIAMIVLLPFLYGILAFVFTAICCLLYNMAANWFGGMELDLEIED